MPFLDPSAHKVDLRAALDEHGWDVETVESAADAWWMNELWRIRSRWRPQGAALFVSFIGDQDDEHRPPRRVADVAIGKAPAQSVHDASLARFQLAPDWPAQRAKILAHATQLRDEIASTE